MFESLAYLAIGAVSGLLAGLFGIGGGAVMVPALLFTFGSLGIGGHWAAHLALGTSLAAIIGTGLASTLSHHQRGGVRWDLVRLLIPGILSGALTGPMLAGWLPGTWLRRLFAAFLIFIGLRLIAPQQRPLAARPLPGHLAIIGIGGMIGMFSALAGIGGGTLTVPFLSRHGIGIRQAVGTSAACGVPIAVAGTLGFILSGWGESGLPPAATGFIYWPAVCWILAASLLTAPVGAQLAHRLPVSTLRRLFGLVLLLIALRLAFG